jgi:hypothetical protein
MVEHVKAFVESVCLTIVAEFGDAVSSSTPTMTELLVAALSPLGLRNTRGASRLDSVLSAFNRLADALADMRNHNGPVAHGKDGFLDPLTTDHARAFLHTGDAILAVLLNALEGKQPDLYRTREPYESFPHLNERIDGGVTVEARIEDDGDFPVVSLSFAIGPKDEAIKLRAEPSRLLYGIDRSAYVEVLKTIGPPPVADVEDVAEESKAPSPEPAEIPPFTGVVPKAPVVNLVSSYEGLLDHLRPDIISFLRSKDVVAFATTEGGARLIDSLLATTEGSLGLDWEKREILQATLKVVCRRLLAQFGISPPESERVAEEFVSWLRDRAPEIDSEALGAQPASMGEKIE